MRAQDKSRDAKCEVLRLQLEKLDEAIYSNPTVISEGGRVITRVRFSIDDLKKASTIRRKVTALDAKRTKPRNRKISQPSSVFVSPPDLLTEQMLATRWFCSRSRLQHWRSDGEGPHYLKIGGRILYRLADVQDFETANHVRTRQPA